MRLRERGYELELNGDKIKLLEERILESGICSFSVPMWFSRNGDKVKATYECSGYISLRELNFKGPRETFEIIEKTLLTLNRSIEFYIPPENVTINLDTVFFNKVNRRIKIAYIPDDNKNLHEKIEKFLDDISKVSSEDTKIYLDVVRKDIPKEITSLKDIAIFIGQQRKKINSCQGRLRNFDSSNHQ